MKILYVWHAAVEKNYRKLLSEMAKEHEIILATAHRWFESSKDQFFNFDAEIDNNLKVYKFFTVFYNHIRSFCYLNFFKIIFILLKKPDIIYLKEEPYSINAFQWVFLCRIFSKKTKIVIESDENLNIIHPLFFRIIEKFVLRKIDAIACVPQKGIELYKSKGFNKKIFKTFYFYNEELFKPIEKKIAISNIGTNKNGVLFGYAGRLTEEKGIEDLILAFSELYKEYKDIYLIIAGKGQKDYEEKLNNLIQKYNLTDNITFLGSLPIEDLKYFYNSIDVFILPSHSTEWWIEQFGRVIVESMACGTPVIGSSSGEIPYVINNKDLIYEEKNIKELKNIMKKFITKELSKEKLSNLVISEAKKYSLENAKNNKLYIMEETLKD
ncbi:MAG: glycosyltransferase [Brevinematales bacterium]|nr:glycosyltransferase [Brevinematales bacterium]